MGRLLAKARTWDDRLESARSSWILRGPEHRAARWLRPARVRVAGWFLIALAVLVAALQVTPLWPLVAIGVFAAPVVCVYLLVQAATESGARRALERHAAMSQAGRRLDS